MGMSIDSIVTKWEKKKVKFNRLVISDKFPINLVNEDVGVPYRSLRNDYCLLSNNSDRIEQFTDIYFAFYKKNSAQFLMDAVRLPDSKFKEWLLKHPDALLTFDYDCFYASYSMEEYERELWRPVEHLPVREDGKLLVRAASNLEMYGLSLSEAMLSVDYLDNYAPGSTEEEVVETVINSDKAALAEQLEKLLSTIVKKEEDDFFEDRMPRLRLLLEALKQNGTFVYSV